MSLPSLTTETAPVPGALMALPLTASTVAQPGPPSGTVMAYTQGLRGFASEHEQMTRMEVVRRLARLKGCAIGDEFAQPQATTAGPVYLVPSDTLVGCERAAALGVRGRDDLFGGVVPWAFVATKAISHPLVHPAAAAPEGWNPDFHPAVTGAVLKGYTAFARADALQAGALLLAEGALRVKPVRETGGRGQTVVRNAAALRECLERMPDEVLERDGVVLEQNLEQVETLSVGQVHVAGITATYYGTQRLVRNNKGDEVYGGSALTVVRGDFDALLAHELPPAVRTAVEQALVYDSAATACYPGFFASRINYDIAQGLDAARCWQSGVLEQSWRAGGATGAEIAALEVLRRDPACHSVRTRCLEVYGADAKAPAGATLYFQGIDDHVGPLTKYAEVVPDGDAA